MYSSYWKPNDGRDSNVPTDHEALHRDEATHKAMQSDETELRPLDLETIMSSKAAVKFWYLHRPKTMAYVHKNATKMQSVGRAFAVRRLRKQHGAEYMAALARKDQLRRDDDSLKELTDEERAAKELDDAAYDARVEESRRLRREQIEAERRAEEELRMKMAADASERRRIEEERKAAALAAMEEERIRKEAEAEEERLRQEEEAARLEELRLLEEEERRRQEEEAARLEEEKRLAALEAARLAEEEAIRVEEERQAAVEAARLEAEAAARREEQERLAEEARLREEEEERLRIEEGERLAEEERIRREEEEAAFLAAQAREEEERRAHEAMEARIREEKEREEAKNRERKLAEAALAAKAAEEKAERAIRERIQKEKDDKYEQSLSKDVPVRVHQRGPGRVVSYDKERETYAVKLERTAGGRLITVPSEDVHLDDDRILSPRTKVDTPFGTGEVVGLDPHVGCYAINTEVGASDDEQCLAFVQIKDVTVHVEEEEERAIVEDASLPIPSEIGLVSARIVDSRIVNRTGNKFIQYKLEIRTTNYGTVYCWKRYSTFRSLCDRLIKENGMKRRDIPELPPRHLVGNFSQKTVGERAEKLNLFLNAAARAEHLQWGIRVDDQIAVYKRRNKRVTQPSSQANNRNSRSIFSRRR